MVRQNNNSGIKAFSNGIFAIAFILLIIQIKILRIGDQFSISEAWLSFKVLSPFFFAFLLSLVIILISWFSHRSILLIIDKSSQRFVYANVFLLLTILFLPIPAAFLAEHGLTGLAGRAVLLYSVINFIQAIAWTVMIRSTLYPIHLGSNDSATKSLESAYKKCCYLIFFYAVCAVLAFWFPLVVAMLITLTWIFMTGFWFSFKERNSST
jgi:uncharacterized membrane protein